MPRGTNLDERQRAREMALRLLTHRSRSTKELQTKLGQRGVSRELIEAEITRLVELGLLDDEKYVREKTESMIRRRLGPKAILAKLEEAGIDRERARSVLEEALLQAGGEQALVADLLEKRFSGLVESDQGTRIKAARFLGRRGFSANVISAACRVFAQS